MVIAGVLLSVAGGVLQVAGVWWVAGDAGVNWKQVLHRFWRYRWLLRVRAAIPGLRPRRQAVVIGTAAEAESAGGIAAVTTGHDGSVEGRWTALEAKVTQVQEDLRDQIVRSQRTDEATRSLPEQAREIARDVAQAARREGIEFRQRSFASLVIGLLLATVGALLTGIDALAA
ncbi:MAG: hypothetical protein AB7H85_11490 [Dehalococcoidia bacterium]